MLVLRPGAIKRRCSARNFEELGAVPQRAKRKDWAGFHNRLIHGLDLRHRPAVHSYDDVAQLEPSSRSLAASGDTGQDEPIDRSAACHTMPWRREPRTCKGTLDGGLLVHGRPLSWGNMGE